jgi:hypothetical protein
MEEFLSSQVFLGDFFLSSMEHFAFRLAWNHDDSVKIGEPVHPLTRTSPQRMGMSYAIMNPRPFESSGRIPRNTPESEFHDFHAISNLAVTHTARGAIPLGNGHQFPHGALDPP